MIIVVVDKQMRKNDKHYFIGFVKFETFQFLDKGQMHVVFKQGMQH